MVPKKETDIAAPAERAALHRVARSIVRALPEHRGERAASLGARIAAEATIASALHRARQVATSLHAGTSARRGEPA